MSSTITFEVPEDQIRIVDEIAENIGLNRDAVLCDAVAQYLAGYPELNAEIDEARRQIDAGHFTLHEDVMREFQMKTTKSRPSDQ